MSNNKYRNDDYHTAVILYRIALHVTILVTLFLPQNTQLVKSVWYKLRVCPALFCHSKCQAQSKVCRYTRGGI